MNPVWLYTILSVILVSLISLIGILTLSIKEKKLDKILIYLVSFSAGALLGDVFIHLLPETIESGFTLKSSIYILIGILFSFVIEKIIHWRHCHHPPSHNHPHPFALMNLVGDIFHNLLDGIIIAISYLASIPIGIATTLAVVFHEVPQEIGDFGVLLHGGFKKSKALFLNFLTALSAILGAALALILSSSIQNLTSYLIPLTIGNFIYIASSDLIPELHKCEFNTKQSLLQLLMIVLGILIMFFLS
ncbi:MAG: ZIP family metal transporter [Nanoarchaeota archaeon]|jgi:zinc and cadmium transporter|nr:ZIP family metal transporter [Nanoarchaeota archaeon]|tara:strand:+ start:10989 stop:11729 length:741 start_codon:yes stop_codon:yes gene_type:complete